MKQDFFVAAFIQHRGSVHKACKEVGISRATYSKWAADDHFVAKLSFGKEAWVEQLRQVAYELATTGDRDMLKFLLTAYAPDEFDAGIRKQKLVNKGTMDVMNQMTREMTQEDVAETLRNDPMVDYHDKEYWERVTKQ